MAIADAHFSIGKSHRVCEDYARAGILPADRPFAIVSDGCSSSPDTDFGSRLLTVTAQERILHDKDHYAPRGVVWQASSMARALLLPPHCLDATLLTIHQLSSGVFRVYAVGDGAVAARRRDGTVDIWRIQFFALGHSENKGQNSRHSAEQFLVNFLSDIARKIKRPRQ